MLLFQPRPNKPRHGTGTATFIQENDSTPVFGKRHLRRPGIVLTAIRLSPWETQKQAPTVFDNPRHPKKAATRPKVLPPLQRGFISFS
ncbi:MAG: hypothetical protein NTX56_11740, partial [Proteobacteria bacterium]|nr:hypothetical protein [Pseudomonadota bacterium]